MHVAIPLYPRYTALDIVGPYTVLAFAPGWRVSLVASETGTVVDDRGSLALAATATFDDVPSPDVILMPGGPGSEQAILDETLLSWVRAAHGHTTWTTSVCSGSLVLAAAGILAGRRATSHFGWRNLLTRFGVEPVDERVVVDGKVVTSAGVSAGIDMALVLLGRTSGDDLARAVQLALEYDPHPPYDSGAAANASADLQAAALALI